jgi:hypothetical protein
MAEQSRHLEISLAVIAIVIGIATMVIPNAEALHVFGIGIAVAILLAALVVSLRRPPHITGDVVPMKFSFESATPEDLNWIAGIEKSQYHGDAIPLEILREWYAVNPNAFIVIRDGHGARIGQIDVLPVLDGPFRLFVEGTITERGIRGTCLVSAAARSEARDLYVESVVVLSDDNEVRRAAVRAMLENLDGIFGRVAEPSNIRHIYGLAATKAGVHFMERWGFEIITDKGRMDKHPLYRTLYQDLKERVRLSIISPR